MSSTPTTRNGFDKQAYGDNPDLWGIQNLNTDLDLIDESLDGVTTVTTTGGSVTLDATNYATNEARKRVLVVSAVLVSALTIIIPNVQKWYIVKNNTSGAYSVTINTAAGVGAVVTQGCTWLVRCDGVGSGTVTIVTPAPNLLPLASGTLDMNANKITGLTAGAAASDAVRYDQLPGPSFVTAGGDKTAGFTAVINTAYNCVFTANGTILLPAAATASDRILLHLGGNFVYTLDPNGLKINGSTATFAMMGNQTVWLGYNGATWGWV